MHRNFTILGSSLYSPNGKEVAHSLAPQISSHTVIMQFEFLLIFVRNFTCPLGKLQTKSMSVIGNSISPEQQRPFFAHCTIHVYEIGS